MIARIAVTLSALLLIGASSNPHAIRIDAQQLQRYDTAHFYLGVAVLGHHVSRIESGWLVKQAQPGFMEIDWRASGKWDGLTRTGEGPRDVSLAQLNAAVRAIEKLGFPRSAIRAWRVPAPVGLDGFNDGDKVLTIGEILVDLGTVDEARIALDRWEHVEVGDDDPLDSIPLTNVSAAELYVQPDCAADEIALRVDALANTGPVAAMVASAARTSTTLSAYDAPVPANVLCPLEREPHFFRTGPAPSISWDVRHAGSLVSMRGTRVTYTLAGLPDETFIPPVPDALSDASGDFDLNEPYIATIAKASATVTPDAVIVHFRYDLGAKTRPGYADSLKAAQARIAGLQAFIPQRDDVAIEDLPAQAYDDVFDVFVRVRRSDLSTVHRIEAIGRQPDARQDAVGFAPLVSDCGAVLKAAVARALSDSRRKAVLLARLMHASVRGLGAARIDASYGAQPICGMDPNAPITTLASLVTWDNEISTDTDPADVPIYRTADAAWILDGVVRPARPLSRTSYESNVRGNAAADALETAALVQAGRQAIVDDSRVISMFEAQSGADDRDGTRYADEKIVVLR